MLHYGVTGFCEIHDVCASNGEGLGCEVVIEEQH
jgi:hypothetical protein